ncbi:thiamine biosynthesis lipoprotein [Sporobacter termitidis DSM 10068]|uniref:FAD:protein FMN transferase n=1 Tax=Sporobacter termitidis DSM 10068 TaxID=1123282 RepID=A0A1M5Z0F5_9FIRM|nr:FAD:protein FMN transferase [Sporobacter termitidis]SHI17614.1 thiamine biosynthesis lipoprotein [Sporobacter termitidis DSM 10068]
MKRINKILILVLAVVIAGGAAAAYFIFRKDAKPYISDTKFLLNTVCTVSLYDKQDSAVLQGAFDVLAHYEQLFSVNVESSDIYKINHASGAPVQVDPDTIDVIRESVGYSEASGGLFDITVGALSTLWNIEGDAPKVPPEDQIAAAMKTIDYNNIVISGDTVALKDKDARLDLGGVAKGFIADKVRDYLKSKGVGRAIINLGGNVEVIGSKAADTPWIVGVQQPFMDRNEDIGFLYVADKSVVTSGIYERYFVQDGKLYAHILDPRTGYPVENNLSSVTIVSDNSKQGDGLAATCFLLGVEKATQLVESMDDIQAIFITKDGQVITTKGIGDKIKFVPAGQDAASGAASTP